MAITRIMLTPKVNKRVKFNLAIIMKKIDWNNIKLIDIIDKLS